MIALGEVAPRRLPLKLAGISLAIFLLIQTGGLGSIDTARRLQVTHSLWTSAPEVVQGTDGYGIPGRHGLLRANWGIGQSLVMLPGDVLGTLVAKVVPGSEANKEKLRTTVVALTTFPILNTLLVLVAFHLLKEFGLRWEQAALAALSMELLTTMLFFGHVHQENNLLLLCSLSSYLGVARWVSTRSRSWLLIAACAMTFAMLVRLPAAVDGMCAGLLGVLLLRRQSQSEPVDWGRYIRDAFCIVLPIALAGLAIDRVYHWYRFGTFSGTYTALWGELSRSQHPEFPLNFPFSGRMLDGLIGPFVSLDKCMFVFDPVLMLSPLLLLGSRRFRQLPAALLLGVGAIQVGSMIFIHARLAFWGGDSAWSDRFISVGIHVCCLSILGGVFYCWSELGRTLRGIVIAVLATSFVIQLSSIVYNANLEIAQRACMGVAEIFVVRQRWINIAAGVLGKFNEWKLLCSEGFTGSPGATRFDFMPFSLAETLPRGLTLTIQFAWGIAVLVVAASVALFVRSLARSPSAIPGDELAAASKAV